MTDAPDLTAAGFATRAIRGGRGHDVVRPSVGLDHVADLDADLGRALS